MPRTDSAEATLADILSVLESKAKGNEERCEAYNKLTRHFRENEKTIFGTDVSKNIARVLKVIRKDVYASSHEVKNVALQILGACLYDTDIVRHIKKTDCMGMLKTLCQTVHNTKEKNICSCALWCLKSQNLDATVITEKVEEVLMAVEYAMEQWSGISVSVVHECISVIERLYSQAPKEMGEMTLRWGKLLLPLVIHGAIQVREGALDVIEVTLDRLKEVHKDLVDVLKPLFRQKVMPGLKAFFKDSQKTQVYALKCWTILVQIFGEELHHSSYINEFLPVVELGFKSTEPLVKVAAFQAWRQLIDNFALKQSVIQDPKRIKLVMQVFKHNNARSESVAKEKLNCWWHFLWLLGNKVSPNFDMVAGPLLQFCIGGRQPEQNGGRTPRAMKSGASPATPHLKLTNQVGQDLPVFQSLQLLGCEALAHFLGNLEDGEMNHKFKLDPLLQEVVTGPAFFIKHSALLITSATQLFSSLGKDVPECLVLHSWQWLIAHLKNAVESPTKLDIRETLSTLFLQFQILVNSKSLSNDVILRMFHSLCFIPRKVFGSSAYSIGGEEMIHGTPALFITGLLLTPVLLTACSTLESYHDLFSSLLANGTGNSSGTLGFLQSVLEILKENAQCVHDKETLWRLWSAIEHPLLQHISKTNEINQGDSLEHDFTCSVQTMVFPVIQDLHQLPQSLVKSMIKSWSELYKTVNRLAAVVANAEANIVCEEVCSQVLDHYLEKDTVEATEVDMLVQMCRVVVTSLYFSSLGDQPMFRISVSPKKFAKNRHKPLENIHSVVALLGLLQKKAIILAKDSESFKKSTGVSIQTVLNNLVETFSTIFIHVTSSNVISNLIGQLARPIGDLFKDAEKKTSAKVYNNLFDSKLEKLWLDITTCLQSRFTGVFDSEFLEKCSPLLEATFLHSRRQMKNQTMSLWTCTFGKAAFLSYPELLKPVLSKVKAKTMIQLPNWVATISPVVDETPVSQMTQTQAPEPRIPGMPSPHKIHGSFLNRPLSPKLNRSPARDPSSPVAIESGKKKKLNLAGFNDGDFVLIKHTPKKKMVLTEHQREVMKEKSALPAMYNGLDHSVDASLMAAHFTTDTQMDGTFNDTPTPTTSQPFSLFGSVIPPTNQERMGKEQVKIKSRKPVTNKLERMKAAESIKRQEEKNSFDRDSESCLRRSSRVRAHEEKNECSENKTSKVSPSPVSGKKKGMKRQAFDNNLIIIDDEDEPTDGEFGNEEEPTDTEFFGNDEESTDIDFGNDDDVGGSVQKKVIEKVDVNKTPTGSNDSDGDKKVDSSINDSGSVAGGMTSSVPQNVLGAIDFFQSLSGRSKLSKSKSLSTEKSSDDISGQDEIASTDYESDVGDSRTIVPKDVGIEHEKAASQPLQSWTQKLNELSTSPRPVSPVRKWYSQDSSPDKRTRTSKSSKRSKKKPADENEENGTLDKWIVPSPVKNFQGNFNRNIVVANLNSDAEKANFSQTLVEETQSPTKFANKGMKDEILSSIMETPPKNVLENITVSHSNSNRTLFSSLSSKTDYNFVEDSNIVPASPNSKSFQCGTPVLKLKKLTNEEIKRYSPSGKNMAEKSIQQQDSESNKYEYPDKSKRMINVGGSNDGLLPNHDDFSTFTPLEKRQKEMRNGGLFSNDQSGEEQAMLKLTENSRTEKVSHCSDSEIVFSQSEKDNDENCNGNSDERNHLQNECNSVEILHLQSEKHDSKDQSQKHDSQDTEIMDEAEGDKVKQDIEINKVGVDSVDQSSSFISSNNNQVVGPEKRGRGRKRKQITPKKLTLEDIKRKKRKEEDEDRVVAKKLSQRLKEKKEKGKVERRTLKTKLSGEGNSFTKDEPVRKKGNDHSLQKNDLTVSSYKSSPRRSKRHNSGSPNDNEQSPSSADSSLEVSVLEDILDLEEDHHCVKTLTEIKKDLKKNRNKTEKKDQQKTANAKRSKPQNTTEHLTSASPVKVLEKMVQSKPEDNTTLINEHQNSLNVGAENHDKDVNGNNFMKIKVPEYEDISDSEMDIQVYENNERVHEKKYVDLQNNDQDMNQYYPDPVGMNLEAEDVPYLEVEEGVPFIAVKLGDSDFQHKMECKTDGTLSSPTTDRVDDCLGILIESSDEEKDLPDIEKRYYDDNVDTHSETEVNEENGGSFFSDDDVPIAEMTKKVLEEDKNNKKLDIKEMPEQEISPCGSSEKESETTVKRNAGKQIPYKSENNDKFTKSVANIVDMEVQNEEENLETEDCFRKSKEKESEMLLLDENIWNNDENFVDETPRKEVDVTKSRVAAMLMLRNSDSKLLKGSKFKKKSGVARRSILKPSLEESLEETQSPKRTAFHPITVERIYSPTASPSASILKKRRFSDDCPSETNSPPAKQRRVSFATPLADLTRGNTERPPSPLVKQNATSVAQESLSLTQSSRFVETQSTQGSPSQKNYESSQDTQTNNTDPVCPELLGCDQSVEKILPQLTSSIWSRGLGQLVRARNIRTIGDLSALSELDIHGLPIRSPKVDTVKKVLTKFGKNIGCTRPERSSKMRLDSQLKSAEAYTEIKQHSELSSLPTPETAETGITNDVDAILANSSSLLDEVNGLTDDIDKPGVSNVKEDKPESQMEFCAEGSSKPDINLTDALLHYCDKNHIDVNNLSANELVKISHNLTAMLSEVNKAIEAVVNTRCRSPWR